MSLQESIKRILKEVYVFDNHIKQLEKLWSKTHRDY